LNKISNFHTIGVVTPSTYDRGHNDINAQQTRKNNYDYSRQ